MEFPSHANNCTSQFYLSNELLNTSNKDCMETFHPWEVDASISHLGARKPFGTSPPNIRVLDL